MTRDAIRFSSTGGIFWGTRRQLRNTADQLLRGTTVLVKAFSDEDR
jgi:hypothetical protein